MMLCPRCRETDDRWVRIMAGVPLDKIGGRVVDLYRHRACREVLAVLTSKAEAVAVR